MDPAKVNIATRFNWKHGKSKLRNYQLPGKHIVTYSMPSKPID